MHKILIIDDDVDITALLRRRLVTNKFDVVIAHDSMQGTALAHKEKPDLIILDIQMPAGGGMATLKNLKMSTHTNRIPIVVFSGLQDEILKQAILNKGVEDFIGKPYDPENLISRINAVLLKSKPPQETKANLPTP